MTVLYNILGIIVFIIVLMVIVAVHEGGHFLVAKKSGILCHEYSIGMGPLIVQKKKGETMYSFRAIPIGGYVAMAGEEVEDDVLKGVEDVKLLIEDGIVKKIVFVLDNPKYQDLKQYHVVDYDLIGTAEAKEDELFIKVTEEGSEEEITFQVARDCMINYKKKEEMQIAPYDRNFTNKPWINRFLSVLAGPLMNFIFAWVIFLLMGIIFGYADTSSTKVASVSGAAVEAGMVDGDTIYSINGVTLSDWDSLQLVMAKVATGEAISDDNPGITYDGKLDIVYKHNDEGVSVVMIPKVYFASSDLIVAYSAEAGGVIINNDEKDFKDTKVAKAGLNIGDKIYKINDTEINGIDDILKFYDKNVTKEVTKLDFYVASEDPNIAATPHTIAIYTLGDLEASNIKPVNVVLGVSTGSKFQFGKLLYVPFVQTGKASVQIIMTLKQLFSKNSSLSIKDLSGPVGIASLFVRLVKGDDAFYNVLYWTGLISVNLGVINLLPLPALDGGRIAFLIYEGITRKKPSPKVENIIHTVGLILLLALSAFILLSDIIKCF